MKTSRFELAERFEHWLADMDDEIARAASRLPSELRDRLDFSPQSLDFLERWMLERFPSSQHVVAPEALVELDGVVRYVGETFRRVLGGRWVANADDPQNAFYGLPLLTGFSENPTPIAPHALVSAAADRRTGCFWRTVLENSRKRIARNT
jgi:hypothetical protein